jgi:hypothetical protein
LCAGNREREGMHKSWLEGAGKRALAQPKKLTSKLFLEKTLAFQVTNYAFDGGVSV